MGAAGRRARVAPRGCVPGYREGGGFGVVGGCVGVVEVGGCWGLSAHTSFEAEYPGGRRTCIMPNQQLIWRTRKAHPWGGIGH